jgi:DNA polymerase-1
MGRVCYYLFMPKTRPKLILLDANALLHRAWHAIPPLKSPDGILVNAAYGVTSVVLKILKEEKPDAFISCWDTAAPTFRHEAYKEYKATRVEKEAELYDQIPITKEVLETIGIPSFEKDGYEADDLIGTLSVKGADKGYHVRIVTGDRDALQLITPNVDVLTFKKGVSVTKLYTKKEVEEEYGVTPERLIDWKAIKGDPSDNIPGIAGIGNKGATELLQKFKTLDGVIKAAHDDKSDIKEGMRKKILEGEKDGREALMLVAIDLDVPLKKKIEDLHAKFDRDAFIKLAGSYGFRSLISRLPGGGSEKGARGTPADGGASGHGATGKSSKGFEKVKDERGAATFIERLANEKLIVLDVVAGQQGSLFGSGVEGIVIGTKESSVFIPAFVIEKKAIKKSLGDLLGDPKIEKICHDAKEQMRLLEMLDLPLQGIAHDTLLAAYLLAAGERSFDLEVLSLHLLGQELPVGEKRNEVIVEILISISDKQSKELNETKLDSVMERFELPLIPVLRDMERNGILIDVSYLEKLSKDVSKDKEKIENKMQKIVGHDFNPASPSQLATILFDELGLPTKGIKRGKTGYSTAASELEKLEGEHEIIELIHQHRELAKLLSTYIDTLPSLADKEGRVHTTLNQAVTATGRLSSSDPNLQNIPVRTELGRKIRRAFIAAPGTELVACDYSQVELRVVAALAKDKKMLQAFTSGADIHTTTAAEIWGVDPKDVTKDQRRSAKAINFGIIYGQGPMGLSRSAGISFAEAKDFIAKYFDTYKGIKTYLEVTKIKARKNGYVETLFGRRRSIPDIVSGVQALQAAAERMAINMPVQGTSADLMKLAMIKVAEGLPDVSKDSRLLLQVHDELLLEVPKKDVQNVASFVKETMERIEEIGVPIVVDAKVGKNWQEMKEI